MADVTISNLSPITPSTGLVLPVSNGSNTGKVTLAEVCGVMTSTQITNALGYVPVQPTSPAIAKAWAVFNYSGGIVNLYASYNISQVQRVSQGQYRITFPEGVFPDGFYVIAGCAGYTTTTNMLVVSQNYGAGGEFVTSPTTCRITFSPINGSASDPVGMARIVFFR